jgi:hypothetical protein
MGNIAFKDNMLQVIDFGNTRPYSDPVVDIALLLNWFFNIYQSLNQVESCRQVLNQLAATFCQRVLERNILEPYEKVNHSLYPNQDQYRQFYADVEFYASKFLIASHKPLQKEVEDKLLAVFHSRWQFGDKTVLNYFKTYFKLQVPRFKSKDRTPTVNSMHDLGRIFTRDAYMTIIPTTRASKKRIHAFANLISEPQSAMSHQSDVEDDDDEVKVTSETTSESFSLHAVGELKQSTPLKNHGIRLGKRKDVQRQQDVYRQQQQRRAKKSHAFEPRLVDRLDENSSPF